MFSILVVIFFVVAAGLCFLQVFLSKRASAVPGLILPFVSLLVSIVIGSGALYAVGPEHYTLETMEDEKYSILYYVDKDILMVNYANSDEPVETYFIDGDIYDAATKEKIELADAYDFTHTSVVDGANYISIPENQSVSILFVLLAANIPTIAYFIIYAVCREKKKITLEKMIAQDL